LCFDFAQHHQLVEWSNLSRGEFTKPPLAVGERVRLKIPPQAGVRGNANPLRSEIKGENVKFLGLKRPTLLLTELLHLRKRRGRPPTLILFPNGERKKKAELDSLSPWRVCQNFGFCSRRL
jgi:hypothetical protein